MVFGNVELVLFMFSSLFVLSGADLLNLQKDEFWSAKRDNICLWGYLTGALIIGTSIYI